MDGWRGEIGVNTLKLGSQHSLDIPVVASEDDAGAEAINRERISLAFEPGINHQRYALIRRRFHSLHDRLQAKWVFISPDMRRMSACGRGRLLPLEMASPS